MKRPLAALLCLASASALAEEKTLKVYGYAYDVVNNTYAYTQIDEQRVDGGKWLGGTTHYYTPDGKEFGVKTLDFTGDPFLPVYKLQFKNLGYAEAITANGAEVSLFRRADNDMKRGSFKKENAMVADAGLANLLAAHYDELLKPDATIKFTIVAPSQLDSYAFKAKRIEDGTFEGKPTVRFQVDMDSLLKLFAGPLVFVYDAATRKIVEFDGQSEVLDPKSGKAFTVKLIYPSARPKDAPAVPP